MSLSIYTHDNDSADISDTDRFGSCQFGIGLSPQSFGPAVRNLPLIQGKRITKIFGVADETISIGYSTEWGDSPGAKLANKLKEFTRSDAFKMFSGKVFNPNVATDKWTQQYPKDGAFVSAGIKFRAYFKANYLNSNSYMTIIPFLIYVTSPMTDFSLLTEISNIKNAVVNAKKEGENLGKELSAATSKNGTFTDTAVGAAESLAKSIKELSTDSRGTATFVFSFGDLIKGSNDVDWIIESWKFTPSMPMTKDNYPLWVDFEVNLQTNQKLSYSRLKKIFKNL